jgi:hypothetical protein
VIPKAVVVDTPSTSMCGSTTAGMEDGSAICSIEWTSLCRDVPDFPSAIFMEGTMSELSLRTLLDKWHTPTMHSCNFSSFTSTLFL